MTNASEDIEVLRSELYTIAILLVLVIVSYLLLGSSNIFLSFGLTHNCENYLANHISFFYFLLMLVNLIDTVIPLCFLMYTHHKSFRPNLLHEPRGDPAGLDVTFYDDLTSFESIHEEEE